MAIKEFNFTKPGHVGDHIWFRTTLLKTSHHTMTFFTEVIGTDLDGHTEKVGEGVLVFVAVNEDLKPISVTPYHITNSKQRASVNQLIAAKL